VASISARPAGALLAAAGCAAAGALTWAATFHVPALARFDAHTMRGFAALHASLGEYSGPIVQLVGPRPFAVAGALLIGIAAARRRPRLAVAAAVTLGGANVSGQVLKTLLAAPRGWGIDAESWPSGHATAAMSLALCLVLVAPVRWRPLAGAVAGVSVVAAGFAILIAGGHFPSDVLGGYLLAGAWTALVVAALRALPGRRAAGGHEAALRAGQVLQPIALAVVAMALAVLAAALGRADAVLEFMDDHTTFVVGAVCLALAALGLAAATSLGLTRQR
jgi:membrane-associated phospholipid phosphatase